MHRLAALLLAILALFGLTRAPLAQTSEYATLATISATMGVNGSRVCMGESSRGDIGCPSYAPSVNAAGLLNASSLIAGGLTVTGATSLSTISATVGDFTTLRVNGVAITGGGGGGGGWVDTTSLVLNQSVGTSWIDLNLSSVIGARSTLVLLRVIANTDGQAIFRTRGEGTEVGTGASYSNLFATWHSNIVLRTDPSGFVQVRTNSPSGNLTIHLLGYMAAGGGGGSSTIPGGVSGSIQFNSGGSFAGRSDVTLDASGNMGLGVADTGAKLNVAGRTSTTVLQLGESNDTCTTATVGTIRRNPATGRFQICRM